MNWDTSNLVMWIENYEPVYLYIKSSKDRLIALDDFDLILEVLLLTGNKDNVDGTKVNAAQLRRAIREL